MIHHKHLGVPVIGASGMAWLTVLRLAVGSFTLVTNEFWSV
ncbi:hypothetical protein [Streptomyces prunicolor]